RYIILITYYKHYKMTSFEYKQHVKEVVKIMDCDFVDPASLVISQIMYLPTIESEDSEFFFDYIDEEIFNPINILNNVDEEIEFERTEPSEWLNLLDGLRSEEHTSELQSRFDLVCRLLL